MSTTQLRPHPTFDSLKAYNRTRIIGYRVDTQRYDAIYEDKLGYFDVIDGKFYTESEDA